MRFTWPRVLLGLLLLLNALPFALPPENPRFSWGLLLALMGLAVLFARVPDRGALTFPDVLRVVAAALCAAGFVFFYGAAPTVPALLFFLGLTALLFVPWRLPSRRELAASLADQSVDELAAAELVTGEERRRLQAQLWQRMGENGK